MGADEAKKIVESITDSITNGEKQECKCNWLCGTDLSEKIIEIQLLKKLSTSNKEPSIINGVGAAIWSGINFGPIGHNYRQSSPLPRICTIPSASAVF
jgi:hypothetical protein